MTVVTPKKWKGKWKAALPSTSPPVASAGENSMEPATPAKSTINWVNIIAIVAQVLALFGLTISADQQAMLAQLIAAAAAAATVVIRSTDTDKANGALYSKINWINIVQLALQTGIAFGLPIPPALSGIIGNVLTIIVRSFFTKKRATVYMSVP